jgi:phospholipid transport system transporter-binding protein
MSLQSNNDGSLSLSGALTFDTVTALYVQTSASSHSGNVDLSGVSSVDSAGLALLLEWQSSANKRNTTLAFINAPSDLRRLAALSEANGLLGLDQAADSNNDQ